ncbi:MAG: C1 family peptidase [Bacilli bacterium]|nr:C1 family peptidase [Bacilli bacterium]
MKEITIEQLNKIEEEYFADKSATVARHAIAASDIAVAAASKDSVKEMDFNFDINIKTMAVSNQKASGRCWIFAACNVMRELIGKKIGAGTFKLSQSYIAFYDKLEKLNYALNALIETIDKDYDDRTVQFLVQSGIGDGGQWDMLVNVVKKYGICPKNAFVETFTSNNTRILNSLLNAEIRRFASESRVVLRRDGMDAVEALKDSYMKRFYKALISCYGIPPKNFDLKYTDDKNEYHVVRGFTPKSFFEKYIGKEIDEYVSCINAPTKSKPFMKSYTVKYLGNVADGKIVKHLNLPMERLKELILCQLKDNQIVWFGSDVASYGDRMRGVWNDQEFDFKSLLDLDIKMEKGESLDFRASAMNHAMCITGVGFDADGVPSKWKIENSWGDDRGYKGYFIMSASWFDQYTYQAVVNKKYLTKEELAAYETEPVVLQPWDPMGSLAD